MLLVLLQINSITTVTSKEKVLVKHCEAVINCWIIVIVQSTSFIRQHFIGFSYFHKLFISPRGTILVWMPILDINIFTSCWVYVCICTLSRHITITFQELLQFALNKISLQLG